MGTMGNTFDVNTVKYGHARKVWREIRQWDSSLCRRDLSVHV